MSCQKLWEKYLNWTKKGALTSGSCQISEKNASEDRQAHETDVPGRGRT